MRHKALSSAGAALIVGAAVLGAVLPGPYAHAQQWPAKSVRVIVPFGAGGATDIQARLLAGNLQQLTGQRFIIENRGGAGGLIGAELVVQSPPDGYTMLFTSATLAINTTLFSKTLKFDPLTDLAPSTLVSSSPMVLCVHPSVPARTVPELLALAKRHPGRLNNGVNIAGSTSHFAAEMLAQFAKLDMQIIPYTGGGPAIAALMTGDIDMLFATGPVATTNLRTGRIRCLAVTSETKNAAFPELPTMNQFVPELVISNWFAMFFPKGTGSAPINGLSGVIRKALDDDKVREFYAAEALDPVGGGPAELATYFASEVKRFAEIIRIRNIPLR